MQDVVINQPYGAGDLFFIEPIYRHFHEKGHHVIAPINPELMWIKEYIPYVEFVSRVAFPYDSEVPVQRPDGKWHIPLRFSHPLYRGFELHYGDDRKNWMRDKYLYLNLDENIWKSMSFEFSMEKIMALNAVIGAHGEYNFVNEYFGGSFEKVNIVVDNGLPNIHLRKIDGFTMLDWISVIQRAKNIYTVETSIVWLCEALNTKAEELHMYPRAPWLENVDYMKGYMTNKNWIFHDTSSL